MSTTRINQLLYLIFFSISFIIVLYCILINNWLVINKVYSKRLWYDKQKTTIPVDDIEQVPIYITIFIR